MPKSWFLWFLQSLCKLHVTVFPPTAQYSIYIFSAFFLAAVHFHCFVLHEYADEKEQLSQDQCVSSV
jgi:hypothetical protein